MGSCTKFFRCLLLLLVMVYGFSPPAAAGIKAIVSIMPQKFFLEQLAGDLVEVVVMVPPGASPHTYEPRPSQMMALHAAKVYFTIGVEFEKAWLERFRQLNKHLVLVDTSQGIEKMPVDGKTKDGGQKQGVNRYLDPHIWLSPRLVMRISRTMAASLISLDPEHQRLYQQRLIAWENKLEQLDEALYQATRPMQNHPYFLVFHPSWGYFARDYGLRQLAVEQHGSEPGPRSLVKLIDRSRQLGIKIIFVHPQYQGNSDRVLARALNGKVVKIDPLATDWLDSLKNLARNLTEVYR